MTYLTQNQIRLILTKEMAKMTANLTTMTIELNKLIIINLIYEPLKVTNQLEFLVIQKYQLDTSNRRVNHSYHLKGIVSFKTRLEVK